MFKIGEFSRITQVSIRMLRYYDENGLLKPKEVDDLTGYRMYSVEQMETLNKIIFLRELGFGVKKMKELLESWQPELIKAELEAQRSQIEDNIRHEQDKLVRLEASLHDMKEQRLELNTQIVIKSIPSYQVMSIRRIVPDYFHEAVIWEEFTKKVPDAFGFSSFSIYHDFDYREQDVDIEACVILEHNYQPKCDDIVIRQTEAIEKAACFLVYGPYKNISAAYNEFGRWLESHPEYTMYGQNRQICHVGPCNAQNESEYVTEMQVPIKITNPLDSHMM